MIRLVTSVLSKEEEEKKKNKPQRLPRIRQAVLLERRESDGSVSWRHLRGGEVQDWLAVRRRISRCILSFQPRSERGASRRHSFPVIHRRQTPFFFLSIQPSSFSLLVVISDRLATRA